MISHTTLEEWAGGRVWYGKKGELHRFVMSMLEIGGHASIPGERSGSGESDEETCDEDINMSVLKPIRTTPLERKVEVEIYRDTWQDTDHPFAFRFGDAYGHCSEEKKAIEIVSSSWMRDQLKAYHHLQNLLFRRHARTVSLVDFDPTKAIESAADRTSDTPAKLRSLYAHFEAPLRAYRRVPDSKRKSGVDRMKSTVSKRACK